MAEFNLNFKFKLGPLKECLKVFFFLRSKGKRKGERTKKIKALSRSAPMLYSAFNFKMHLPSSARTSNLGGFKALWEFLGRLSGAGLR